jgi:hypothetical protein
MHGPMLVAERTWSSGEATGDVADAVAEIGLDVQTRRGRFGYKQAGASGEEAGAVNGGPCLATSNKLPVHYMRLLLFFV